MYPSRHSGRQAGIQQQQDRLRTHRTAKACVPWASFSGRVPVTQTTRHDCFGRWNEPRGAGGRTIIPSMPPGPGLVFLVIILLTSFTPCGSLRVFLVSDWLLLGLRVLVSCWTDTIHCHRQSSCSLSTPSPSLRFLLLLGAHTPRVRQQFDPHLWSTSTRRHPGMYSIRCCLWRRQQLVADQSRLRSSPMQTDVDLPGNPGGGIFEDLSGERGLGEGRFDTEIRRFGMLVYGCRCGLKKNDRHRAQHCARIKPMQRLPVPISTGSSPPSSSPAPTISFARHSVPSSRIWERSGTVLVTGAKADPGLYS
ncbi:hypothetical protein IWX50DRAFT_616221 [Phyllosticta citricarpa]